MATILFFVFLYLIVKGIKKAIRTAKARRQRGTPERCTDPLSGKLASLDALQAQRDIINAEIRRIENTIDNTPEYKETENAINQRMIEIENELKTARGLNRVKLENEYANLQVQIINAENEKPKTKAKETDPGKIALQLVRLYGNLATVENKIYKLTH